MSLTRPNPATPLLPRIQARILLLRGKQVILSHDLAELYGVSTKHLNQAVRRNLLRFPADFMMALTAREAVSLRSQFVTSNVGRGGARYRPIAFTEQGVAMLSSVLNSERAIRVNIAIMRAFVKLREVLATHADLAKKLQELEARFEGQFQVVFKAIRQILNPPADPEPSHRRIGFHRPGSEALRRISGLGPFRGRRTKPGIRTRSSA
ncbi:MAG: ORF6N domain-containing protein [Planctomycetes bacterium]|nr:ORF6N domain-containing protein [Planctomycetota bacterium]